MDQQFWEKFAWVKRGKQRRVILKDIPNDPFMPEEFRKQLNLKIELKLGLSEISRNMTSFEREGLLKCITPNAPYGRLYQITSLGKKIKAKLIS